MFYCPIHKSSSFKEIETPTHIVLITSRQCEACFAIENKIEILDNWFRRSNKKLPLDIKNLMKDSSIEHFQINQFDQMGDWHESYSCYKYVDNIPICVKIHQTIMGNRMYIMTQKSIKYNEEYGDEKDSGPVRIKLAYDNDLLRKLLK